MVTTVTGHTYSQVWEVFRSASAVWEEIQSYGMFHVFDGDGTIRTVVPAAHITAVGIM
jgi:hypothetical protein